MKLELPGSFFLLNVSDDNFNNGAYRSHYHAHTDVTYTSKYADDQLLTLRYPINWRRITVRSVSIMLRIKNPTHTGQSDQLCD